MSSVSVPDGPLAYADVLTFSVGGKNIQALSIVDATTGAEVSVATDAKQDDIITQLQTASTSAKQDDIITQLQEIASAVGSSGVYPIATGGTSQKISISGTSVQTAALVGTVVDITLSTDAYMRAGVNPTALNNGTDQFFVQNCTHRVAITSGQKIAIITEGATGFARVTVVA